MEARCIIISLFLFLNELLIISDFQIQVHNILLKFPNLKSSKNLIFFSFHLSAHQIQNSVKFYSLIHE